MSLVLITGGAGFIGSHLAARLLALGHEVHLADNFQRGARDQFLSQILASDRARMVDLDLRAPETAGSLSDQYDQIYHLAAIVGVANVARAPYSVLADNVAMLDTAIGIAGRQKHLSRFAFTSTSEVYAGTLAHDELTFPTPESSKLVVPDLGSPRTSYMLSKIYGESMCRLSGLPTTIFRPHNIYGPRMGMAHVIPELLQRAYRLNDGDSLEVYSIEHRRTFCYIDDAIEMIHLATDSDAGAGATLNIGVEAEEVSIGDLAGKILNAVGKRGSVVGLPATAGSPSRRVPDTSEVRTLTGYTPSVTLDEGVSRTFDWYRQNVFDAG